MFDSNVIYKAKNEYTVLLNDSTAHIIKSGETITGSELLNTSMNILLIENGAFESEILEITEPKEVKKNTK